MTRPVRFLCEGGAMHPAGPHQERIARDQFAEGKHYTLVELEERSQASHGHMFAWLTDAHANLPEKYAGEPWAQSPEHLRKYALIRTGHCDVAPVACGTEAAAERVAALVRSLDEYAVVSIDGTAVTVFRAHSQSRHGMPHKADFEKAKRDILEFIAGLIGVEPDALGRQQGAA